MSWYRYKNQEKQLEEWANQLNMSDESMSNGPFEDFDDLDADKNYTPSTTSSEEDNQPSTSKIAKKVGTKPKHWRQRPEARSATHIAILYLKN